MKKTFALILALVLMLGVTGCGGGAKEEKFTVGVCQLAPHPALDAATEGFAAALKEILGEEKVEIDVQIAAGDSNTCSPIVNSFVAENVDLIMANATPALQAASAATGDIPILGTAVTEYGVALDIDNFTGTVGGNVSGTSDLAPLNRQAAMLQEWFPEAKTAGLLFCSGEPNSKYQVDTVQKELEALGIACQQFSFVDGNDLAAVVQKACDASDVIYIPTDNTLANSTGIVDGICRGAGVPVIAGEAGICKGCGVATLSISYYDLGYATGKMAAQILTGEAEIASMPVGYAENVTPQYNAEICKDLGLTPVEGYEPLS